MLNISKILASDNYLTIWKLWQSGNRHTLSAPAQLFPIGHTKHELPSFRQNKSLRTRTLGYQLHGRVLFENPYIVGEAQPNFSMFLFASSGASSGHCFCGHWILYLAALLTPEQTQQRDCTRLVSNSISVTVPAAPPHPNTPAQAAAAIKRANSNEHKCHACR